MCGYVLRTFSVVRGPEFFNILKGGPVFFHYGQKEEPEKITLVDPKGLKGLELSSKPFKPFSSFFE